MILSQGEEKQKVANSSANPGLIKSPRRAQYFHPILTVLVVLWICLGSSTLTIAADDANLLTNGNFEADTKRQSWPDAWGRPGDDSVLWAEEGGNHFLRLHAKEPGKAVMVYREVVLPPEVRALELRWRWRISDYKIGRQSWFTPRIMIELKDAAGQKLATPNAPAAHKNTDGWAEGSARFLVPEGAHTLQLMPTLFQVESGTLDIDDLVLQATDPEPIRQAVAEAEAVATAKAAKQAEAKRAKAAATLQASGTLIANGNFETDAKGQGWPDGWGRAKDASLTWEKEGDNHFLRLHALAPGAGVMVYHPVDLPPEVGALELSWRQRITGLKKGAAPWNDARIMMEFLDASGRKLTEKPSPPYSGKDTNGWEEKHTSFLVPRDAVTLVLMPSLFQVTAGTFDLDDLVLKPIDPAPLLAAAKAAAEAEKLAYVAPETPNPSSWPQELHVEGTQVLAKDGHAVWLQGVNVVSLEFLVQGDHLLKSIEVAIDEWKANIIRLPVNDDFWFGKSPLQKDGGAAYRELVDQAITLAANRGAYVLLDLHRFGAPKQEHAVFWKNAAVKYKDHPAVLFDLFNEPHGTTWEVWRDGGFVPEKTKPADEDAFLTDEQKAKAAKGFQSIGMQALLNTVREAGAHNVVIVGGLDWSYDLSGIAQGFALKDNGGHGIIYGSHVYPWKRDWRNKMLAVVDKYPILLGEVGADIHKMDFIPADAQEDPYTWVPDMLGLIQKDKLHWTGFSFHPKASPVMIEDWTYKPTPHWGAFARRALAGEKFEFKKMR